MMIFLPCPLLTQILRNLFLLDSYIMSLKVDELKQQLRLWGLSKHGLKAELQDRLEKAMAEKVPIQDSVRTSIAPNGFKATERRSG